MKKRELEESLIRNGIPKDMYCLDGGFPNEAYCLSKGNQFWEVYYSEKGIKSGLKQFDSEDTACNYIYELISSHPTV
jgi:hypothetical protein